MPDDTQDEHKLGIAGKIGVLAGGVAGGAAFEIPLNMTVRKWKRQHGDFFKEGAPGSKIHQKIESLAQGTFDKKSFAEFAGNKAADAYEKLHADIKPLREELARLEGAAATEKMGVIFRQLRSRFIEIVEIAKHEKGVVEPTLSKLATNPIPRLGATMLAAAAGAGAVYLGVKIFSKNSPSSVSKVEALTAGRAVKAAEAESPQR